MDKLSGPFGSVFWTNYPRNVYDLQGTQEEGESTIHLGLIHETSNEGSKRKPLGMAMEFSEDGTKVVLKMAKMADIPEFDQFTSIADRLSLALLRGKKHVSALVTELEISDRQVRNNLAKHRNPARFKSLGNGVWG